VSVLLPVPVLSAYTLQEERHALARQLLAQLGTLNEAERKTLIRLGPITQVEVIPFIKQYLALYKAREPHRALSEAIHLLDRVRKPGRLMEYKELLLQPGFLENSNCAAELASSRQPEVLAFLKAALANPKAPATLRRLAFLSLANTGGAAMVPTILAVRNKERQRRISGSFPERLQLDTLPHRVLSEDEAWRYYTHVIALEKDGALLTTGELGNADDLWVARWDGARWSDLRFTGESLVPWNGPSRKEPKPPAIRYPLDWYTRFVGNEALTKDADHDGLTDVMEKRLGTDPQRADSDGDGLTDSEERNPLARPRPPVTDEEKIMVASFEALYAFDSHDAWPCVIRLPKGMRPMEFFGLNGRLFALPKAATGTPLTSGIGKGTAQYNFFLPEFDFAGKKLPREKRKNRVLWNATRTEAKISLNRYYGMLNAQGYDVRLRKFGAEWVVIGLESTWVS
jgi:Bacterial TSP3 repeat